MSDPILKAAAFIAEHASAAITLDDVADHVGYSPWHLSRVFAGTIGVSPVQYLAAHRFQKAKTLMLADRDSVIDICHAVGFSSPGTFTRRFVQEVGMTPRDFRRLPDRMAQRPATPLVVPGEDRAGGRITGAIEWSPDARALVGDSTETYLGLYTHRAARGVPVAGTMVAGDGRFELYGVPVGSYWLLASSLPSGADPLIQLLPQRAVVGGYPEQIVVRAGSTQDRDVWLHPALDLSTPITVALPALATPK